MTARVKTVSDHLLEAQAILDEPLKDGDNVVARDKLERVLTCIESALDAIQLVRSEVQAGMDKF